MGNDHDVPCSSIALNENNNAQSTFEIQNWPVTGTDIGRHRFRTWDWVCMGVDVGV